MVGTFYYDFAYFYDFSILFFEACSDNVVFLLIFILLHVFSFMQLTKIVNIIK